MRNTHPDNLVYKYVSEKNFIDFLFGVVFMMTLVNWLLSRIQLYKLSPKEFDRLNVKNELRVRIYWKSFSCYWPTCCCSVLPYWNTSSVKLSSTRWAVKKCGGLGHKFNACPSVDDADYRKIKRPPGFITQWSWTSTIAPSSGSEEALSCFYFHSIETPHATRRRSDYRILFFFASSGSITGIESDTQFEITAERANP